jgi:hypothetical protein
MIATSHGGAAAASLQTCPYSTFRPPSQAGQKIASFLDRHSFDRPTLVLDIDQVAARYEALERGLKDARIHYAAPRSSFAWRKVLRLLTFPSETR